MGDIYLDAIVHLSYIAEKLDELQEIDTNRFIILSMIITVQSLINIYCTIKRR